MHTDQWQQAERFLHDMALVRRLSAHTIKGYRHDLTSLAGFCEREGIDRWGELQVHHLRRFAAASHGSGLHPRSIQRRLSAVRSFLGYLVREGDLTDNPAVPVSAPRAARRLPTTLDVDQMTRLLHIEGDAPIVVRDRAMLELFYSSGLRLAELVGLDPGDIVLGDGTVRVLGKGRKARLVPVGRLACDGLRAWLALRPSIAADGEPALFVSLRGRRISPRAVQQRVRYWARRSGLGQRVHPHLFRHSFATHLLESSGDLRSVQEMLGHANIGTTQVYTHLDFQHLAAVYDKAHPRAKKSGP